MDGLDKHGAPPVKPPAADRSSETVGLIDLLETEGLDELLGDGTFNLDGPLPEREGVVAPAAPAAAALFAGRYRLGEELGRGGMGAVYLAEDTVLRRAVALKVLREPLATPAQRAAFQAEALVTAQLEHPNIVPVHDLGTTAEGDLFFTMKRVPFRLARWGLLGFSGGKMPSVVSIFHTPPLPKLMSMRVVIFQDFTTSGTWRNSTRITPAVIVSAHSAPPS